MDDVEAVPAPYQRYFLNADLVKFKSTGGDARGLVMVTPDGDDPLVRVMLADGTVVTPADLTVVDRGCSMFRSQIITLASDSGGGQVGVVMAVSTELDLIRLPQDDDGDDQTEALVVARGVSPCELRRVTGLCLGDLVVSGPWLGRVVAVHVDVDVAFDGGAAVCRVARANAGGGSKLLGGGKGARCSRVSQNSVYYPGQSVGVPRGSSVFEKEATWLVGSWSPGRRTCRGTVVNVEMADALVYWLASAELGIIADGDDAMRAAAPPACVTNANELTVFHSDAGGSWAVGDRCFFLQNTHSSSSDDATATAAGYVVVDEMGEPPILCAADARTTVDVLWQDGTRQRGVPSASLLPFAGLDYEQDFFPGEVVVDVIYAADDIADDDHATASSEELHIERVGIVRSFNCKDRTARVSWFKPCAEEVECHDEETVSVYHLDKYDYYNHVFYGNIVVRPPSQESSKSTQVASEYTKEGAADLSWVGHVGDLCDGHVQVKWGDGSISEVLHHEIDFLIVRDIDNLEQEILNGDRAQEDPPEEPEANENANAAAVVLIQHHL